MYKQPSKALWVLAVILLAPTINKMLSLIYYVLMCLPPSLLYTALGTALFSVILYWKSTLWDSQESTTLVYKDSALAKHLLRKCELLAPQAQFRPPFWARWSHVQTLLPLVLPRVPFFFDREYLLLKDKGIVGLDWGNSSPIKLKKKSNILIIIPEPTSDAGGFTRLARRAVDMGFRPVVFNRRGQGHSPITTPKMMTFGDPSDLRQVIKYIRGRYPGCKLVLVSRGAGSGLLLSYLGEYGSSANITAAACISPVYDAETVLAAGVPQPYDFLSLLSHKRLISRHLTHFGKTIDSEAVLRSNTRAQLEQVFYSAAHGYTKMAEYWEKNNPIRDVDDISVPLLCINSLDDPVCQADEIPYDLFKYEPNFLLARTCRGGHSGFLHWDSTGSLESWADALVMEYLDTVLVFMDKNAEKNNFIAKC